MSKKKRRTVDAMKKKKHVPKELLEMVREEGRIRKKITSLLRDKGPLTIPEIAKELGLPTYMVMEWVMTWRKYSLIKETEEIDENGYYKYEAV
jgi:predicted transcriptional regulator